MPNTIWSENVQGVMTLYLSQKLRFDDMFFEQYKKTFNLKHIAEREGGYIMKKVFSLKVILPIISGIIVCGTLFFFGIISEAPGICVLGVSAGFILFMLGIKNSGTIRKGLLLPVSLLFFAVLFSFCTTRILINGEFGSPWHSVFGYAVSAILLMIGLGMISSGNKR